MPEGLLMAGFPFRISYHRSLDRERKRFLAPLEMTIRGSDVSESLVPSHQSLVTKISHRKDVRCDHVDDEHDEKERSSAFGKAYQGKSGS